MRVEIRRATAADLAAIQEIQAESPEASAWEPASYLDYDCRVATIDGRVAGFLACREVAPQEREILNVAVAAGDRRRGIGRALVAAEVEKTGASWFLEVRESNLAGISLYSALGFAVVGCRKDYYREPAEAAIVMRLFS